MNAPIRNTSLAWISSGDVAFQLLNRMFLSCDDPLHKVADGEYTLHGLTLHDREVSNTAGGHDGHAFVDGLLRSHEHNWATHNLSNKSLLRRPPFEHDFAGIITFRYDTHQPAFGHDKQSPYL